jgi:glycosyltransferase involved in cell wall biosynthesis
MISTDRRIFEEGSAVRTRQAEYAKQWDEVHIIIFSGKDSTEQSIVSNCFVYPTRSISRFLYPFDAIKLGRFILGKRGITDITCQDPFLTAMAGLSLKKRAKSTGDDVKLELQVHTDIGSPSFTYTIGNKMRKALALSYLSRADAIRVVSGRIKRYLTDKLGIPGSKITVRPIFVDTKAIKNAPIAVDLHKKYPSFDKIVLMASRLELEKNIGLAINSWAEVIKKLPKIGLVIVGAGSQGPKLKRLVTRLGLDASVVFEGWADQTTLYSYYKTADLFLNASLFEGYGMSMVEAHAADCRIVSTDVGVASEVGASIVASNPTELSSGVINILT